MSKDIISEIKKDYIYNLANQNKRVNDRAPNQVREITIERNVIGTAEGSARVKYGNTDVLVGVKLGHGEPYPDSLDKGVLTTNAELIPLASPEFETGPPKEDSIELARVVDRGIRESGTINLDKLCITPGEKVWIVFIDIHVLDYDGNLFDVAATGALCALLNTVVPASKAEAGEDFKLPVEHYPVSCTFAKLGGTIIVDPNLDEEKTCSARLTISTDENGDIRAMQKGRTGCFTPDEIRKMIAMAQELGNQIREKIKVA